MVMGAICPTLAFTALYFQLKDSDLVVSGFGKTFNASNISKGWFYPSRLQTTTLRLKPLEACFKRNAEGARTSKSHLCAGAQERRSSTVNLQPGKFNGRRGLMFKADSCIGDSGGPLTFRLASLNKKESDSQYAVCFGTSNFRDPLTKRHYLVGLVSSGRALCGIAKGSIYVNVHRYFAWIQRTQLDDIIATYRQSETVPYELIDASVMKAIFERLSAHGDEIVSED